MRVVLISICGCATKFTGQMFHVVFSDRAKSSLLALTIQIEFEHSLFTCHI